MAVLSIISQVRLETNTQNEGMAQDDIGEDTIYRNLHFILYARKPFYAGSGVV